MIDLIARINLIDRFFHEWNLISWLSNWAEHALWPCITEPNFQTCEIGAQVRCEVKRHKTLSNPKHATKEVSTMENSILFWKQLMSFDQTIQRLQMVKITYKLDQQLLSNWRKHSHIHPNTSFSLLHFNQKAQLHHILPNLCCKVS